MSRLGLGRFFLALSGRKRPIAGLKKRRAEGQHGGGFGEASSLLLGGAFAFLFG